MKNKKSGGGKGKFGKSSGGTGEKTGSGFGAKKSNRGRVKGSVGGPGGKEFGERAGAPIISNKMGGGGKVVRGGPVGFTASTRNLETRNDSAGEKFGKNRFNRDEFGRDPARSDRNHSNDDRRKGDRRSGQGERRGGQRLDVRGDSRGDGKPGESRGGFKGGSFKGGGSRDRNEGSDRSRGGFNREGGRGGFGRDRDGGSFSRGRESSREKIRPRFEDEAAFGGSDTEYNSDSFKPGRGVQTLKATVEKNQKGFAFLVLDTENYDDLFLNPRDAEQFFHGDRVELKVSPAHDILGIRVLEHRFRELIGRYYSRPFPQIVYERKRFKETIEIKENEQNPGNHKPKDGDWVRIKVLFQGNRTFGEIEEVYGEDFPASADIAIVAGEYNLTEKHSEHAVRQAQGYKIVVDEVLKDPHRVDLRNVPLITIDGETARDFDDAVFVEKKGENYLLWVGIADVSHYVTQGTPLDEEALARGTSVYFPERAFHMLPRELSEHLCSLKPDEPRLAMVAKIEIDSSGKKIHTELVEALIQSKRRATYNEIQKEYEANKDNPNWEFKTHFELYKILRKYRTIRGSIDFELPESEMKVAPDGEPIRIDRRLRVDAHRLIEEFMIAANEAVTEWMLKHKRPFIYRTHDDPSEKSLLKFQKIAVAAGMNFVIPGNIQPKILSEFVTEISGHPAEELLNTMLLRSMRQAVYSSTHGQHFGLASEAYTHFTSPIRRYPDLIVHRLLREVMREKAAKDGKAPNDAQLEKKERDLENMASHCSYRERIASNADREAERLKQVRLMKRHVGDEFRGKVIGMNEAALFLQLEEPWVEGMIPKETLDGQYEFDEDRMVFVSRRQGVLIRIGDHFKVQVVKADMDKREIHLKAIEHEPVSYGERSNNPKGSEKSKPIGKNDRVDRSPRHLRK